MDKIPHVFLPTWTKSPARDIVTQQKFMLMTPDYWLGTNDIKILKFHFNLYCVASWFVAILHTNLSATAYFSMSNYNKLDNILVDYMVLIFGYDK